MTDEESGNDESDRKALQMLMQGNFITTDEQAQIECLKHMKGKNNTTSFYHLIVRQGKRLSTSKNKDATCLMEDKTRYIYKKVEQGNNFNTETMEQEVEQGKLAEIITNKENENPYQKAVLNNAYQDENKTMQMENWSILSDSVRYEQHDERSKTPHRLDIITLDYCQHIRLCCRLKGEESHMFDVDFGTNPETMRSNY